MDRKLYESIKSDLLSCRDEVAETLFSLVKVPSIKGKPENDAPFGTECLRGLEAAIECFRNEGFNARISRDHTYGIVEYGEGERSIGIFAHTDVVPVGDDWIHTKPFEPIRIGDTLLGRGIEDNKSGVVGALFMLKMLRKYNVPLKHRIVVFLGSEEESGMRDIESFVHHEEMPAVSFVPDNGYPFCVGEKSITRLFIRSKRSMRHLYSVKGGLAFNVILADASAAVPLRFYDEICEAAAGNDRITVTKGVDEVVVQAKGITAHASTPDISLNAAKILFETLAKCPSFGSEGKIFADAAYFLSSCHGETLGIPDVDPIFGKLTAANGMINLYDGKLGLSLDIRYGGATDWAPLGEALDRVLAERNWAAEDVVEEKGILVDPDSPLIPVLRETYREITGDATADSYLSGGGTYARHLVNAYSIGTSTKHYDLELPEGHGEAHQSDEAISLTGLCESIAINTMFVLDGDRMTD